MSKILVVDDEPRILLLLQNLLKANGYEVVSARDGASALDIVHKGGIDIAITDLRMSPMDGMTLFREIKKIAPEMPVILLTAYATVETAVEAMKSGIFDYLTKPFAMGELAARIRSVTRRRESFIPKVLKMGNFSLNIEQQELKAVNSIRLSKKESELLEYFILNRDKALAPDEIFSRIWADDPETDHDVVWVYVSYLRSKLDAVSANVLIEGEKTGPYRLKENT